MSDYLDERLLVGYQLAAALLRFDFSATLCRGQRRSDSVAAWRTTVSDDEVLTAIREAQS